MRKRWLSLTVLVLQALALQLAAADKNRAWQTGQIVETKGAASPQIHTIYAGGKNYLVRGTWENGDQDVNVGDKVRFAVEGKNMYISTEGKEYRVYLLGETVATTPPPAAAPPVETTRSTAPAPPSAAVQSIQPVNPPAPAPQPTPVPRVRATTPQPTTTAVKPTSEAGVALDNDAVVKMVVGGLKEDTVVAVIASRPGQYTLTPDALLGLKAAGVPPSVINAMSEKMKPSR